MITVEIFQKRRRTLIEHMVSNSAVLIFSAPQVTRSNDTQYPYRQNSNFWYFTGFNEPQSLLLLIKHNEQNQQSVLFNRKRDLMAEIWSGRRLGQEVVSLKLGIERAFPWENINEQLYILLNGLTVLYHAQGENVEADQLVFDTLEKLRNSFNQHIKPINTLTDWRPIVHKMRLFKSKEEIEILRSACRISAQAHIRAMQICRAGMFEYELEREIQYEFNLHGARFPSYNVIIGAGENACILHYVENNSEMRDGDLVLIDAGCEFHGYAADITRTFPINGKFSKPQRILYNIVLNCLYKSLSLFRPGIKINHIHDIVVRTMTLNLLNIGILKGNLETLLSQQAHYPFFMHGLGHWLGLDVHDVGHYGILHRDHILEPGMVLTVEPGLYISSDNTSVPKQYRGIGIRIEDDILITENNNENLTNSVVKDINEIELIMAKTHN
ncbi:Xaa-Pro aminopeptidase [Candidatus Pantoea carbekii]|uniref:Xaa-Pro aminopeptidase n=1 Tax=Candidatus Pantoea carbekii TaxID=1235990 RepID=U3U1W1_9GAMM|nr:Xaa-Pro aminopeptidase [Candidatus Pantoea carbekii]AKC32389.1 Xaa-Pro aminopeptidase PepP [Candidatus Pantoea carbekii]BAO00111.1 PepP protein [Candidatus Pantoea carbekii]